MPGNVYKNFFVWILILVGVFGCKKAPPPPITPSKKPVPHLVRLKKDFLRKLTFDDSDLPSLKKAVYRSLEYYNRLPDKRIIKASNMSFYASDFKDSFKRLYACLERGHIKQDDFFSLFDFYIYKTEDEKKRLLITGYYEPVIDGSLRQTEFFKYPVYPLPKNLIKVFLKDFGITCTSKKVLIGRLENGRLFPFFSRGEIDKGALKDLKPLFWAKDPLDVFFLQIQGSGVVRFPDGTTKRVGYAGTNGQPYRSIGKYMIERGLVPKEAMSMQAIKKFIRDNPEKMWDILWHNESYVFFRWVESGPKGSLNVLLTPMRSVASDPEFYPRGSLGFLTTVIPSDGKLKSFSRWVLHQDTGGAIKGTTRLDLFFGTGDTAGEEAGRMKYHGMLILALPKHNFGVARCRVPK